MSSAKYARVSVTEQPQNDLAMDPKNTSTIGSTEKGLVGHTHNNVGGNRNHACEQCQSSQAGTDDHRHCHNGRLRRILAPIIIVFVLLGGLLALGCMSNHDSTWGLENLVSRAIGGTTNGTQNTFVHNKLYLIVVFVGLLLVVILAVMLSAWCCKGAFQNPLCCPCYLCACCGGLACLECIGCGLCAEGVDQM